jgi:hypothetical protein
VSVMRPTVIEVASFEHPLFGMELPFPLSSLPPRARGRICASGGLPFAGRGCRGRRRSTHAGSVTRTDDRQSFGAARSAPSSIRGAS